MKHVLPTVLENVAEEVPSEIPYFVQINCILYRFAYFLKLLDGTPYSKATQIWYCDETIVF